MGLTKKYKKELRKKKVNIDLDNLQFFFKEKNTGYEVYSCEICNSELTGELGIHSHLNGNAHKKAVKNYFQEHHWELDEDTIKELDPKLVQFCEMDPFLVWNAMLKSKLFDKFYCQICKKEMSSVEGAFSHVEGAAHVKRCSLPDQTRIIPTCIMEKIEKMEEFSEYRDPKKPPPGEILFSHFCRYCGCFQDKNLNGDSCCEQHYKEMNKLMRIIRKK